MGATLVAEFCIAKYLEQACVDARVATRDVPKFCCGCCHRSEVHVRSAQLCVAIR